MSPDPLDPQDLHRRLTVGQLGGAVPAGLGAARSAAAAAGDELDTARSGLDAAWTGGTARSAQRCLEGRSAALLAADAELAVAQDVLVDLATTQALVRDAADGLLLGWLTTVAARALTDPATTAGVTVSVCRELLGLQSHLDAEITRAAAAFDALAGGAAAAVPTETPVRLPVAGADPREVARWWAGLSAAERGGLEQSAPDALAALSGLPPVVLDRVNRARLARDVAALRDQSLLVAARVVAAAGDPAELTSVAVLQSALGAAGRRAEIATAAVASAEALSGTSRPVLLLRYSPEGGRGVVVAVGDPSTAADVAVTVPGTSSSVRQTRVEQAVALRERMDTDDPGGTHAVVQWVDYQAPESLLDPAVADVHLAARAADDLVEEVEGWRAAAGAAGTAPQHLTAVGHSYGSTVVGLAAAHGLAVDDVVVLGSPGVGVDSAAALGPGVGHVWAATAEHDPVVQATAGSWFSPGATDGPYDPAFGARLFEADDPASLLGAHSTYYDAGSESLRNLAAIATGDTAEVTAPRPDGVREAVDQLVDHAGDAARATAAGDLDAATEAVRAGAADLVGDAGDALFGGLGEAVSQLRGLSRRLGSGWDAPG